MTQILIYDYTNDFAENKDIARDLRKNQIQPALDKKEKVTIDFKNVSSATQSFIHALISEVLRIYGIAVLEDLIFQNCNSRIQTIIEIVVEYVQDGIFTDDEDE
jgi:F0F1-type ATP synthase membrane subunit a